MTVLLHSLLLFLLLFPTLLYSQTQASVVDTSPKYPSLLWKITAPSQSAPSYLYGTMHTNDSATHHLATLVIDKLAACDVVATEMVLNEKGGEFDIFNLMSSMLMKNTSLQELYNEEEYRIVNQCLKDRLKLIYAVVNLDKCKPIFLSSLITDMDPTKTKGSNTPIVDFYFQEQGKAKGKTLVGIETVEEQLHALSLIPLQKQAKMLLQQIQAIDQQDHLAQTLTQLYRAQDLDGLWALYLTQTVGDSALMKEFDQAVVTHRNQLMAERIDSLIQLQPTFVGVGALHLPSEYGLIERLRKRGYRVEAVIFGK